MADVLVTGGSGYLGSRCVLAAPYQRSKTLAERLLGWRARPIEETIVDTAESLLALRN
ncbi:hypothetical protein AB0J86_12225 [Micromonospora sp. NPDC049559]|uniref:hypothetical protein n=1 Tax=Micromonospora sp. NPDC049559 TaxID=3155923 RepID=UPI0034398735